jgi:hypothetical protein
VEAERGRRTLQAWQPWRTVSWCRGDKERAGSACRSGLRTPATCVSVFKLERLRDALIRLRWIPSILVAARARAWCRIKAAVCLADVLRRVCCREGGVCVPWYALC